MRRQRKSFLAVSMLAISLVSMGITSCQNDNPIEEDDKKGEVTNISPSVSSLNMDINSEITFTFTLGAVGGELVEKPNITISVSNSLVTAELLEDNTIKVKSGAQEGSAIVNLKVKDGVEANVTISIRKVEKKLETIVPSLTKLEMVSGESKTVTLALTPNDFKDYDFSLTYDENLIIVTQEDLTLTVTALKAGNTEITIKDKSGISTKIEVAIAQGEDIIFPTSISLVNFNRKIIGIGEEIPLNVEFSPANTTEKNLSYTSNNPSSAIVVDGVLKGVGVGSAVITISSKDASEISRIQFAIEVSNDESAINNDKIESYVYEAIDNEATNIVSGSIEIETKSEWGEHEVTAFTNNYRKYKGTIYNDITNHDGSKTLEYLTRYDDFVYRISQDENGETLGSEYYQVTEDGYFDYEINEKEANTLVSLPLLMPYPWSSSYTQGVGSYLDEELFGGVFFNSMNDETQISTSLDENNNQIIKLSYIDDDSYYEVDFYDLTIVIDENNTFKSIDYDRELYDIDLVIDGVISEGAEPFAYDRFDATFESGELKEEVEKEIDPEGFFYDDFEAKFYATSDESATPKTTFNVMDNITFKLDSFAPLTANPLFDRVEIVSVSNPEVIRLGQNGTSLFANSPGTCEVTAKSRDVTKTYTLMVVQPEVESLEFSITLPDTMGSNDSYTFLVERTPIGSIDDIVVELAPGDEKYVTIGMTDYGYYYIQGNPEMDVDETIITLIAYSKSKPEVRVEKKIKVIRELTDREIVDILTSKEFRSDVNTDYYNYSALISFNEEERSGVFTIYFEDGERIFEQCNFTWAISNGDIIILTQTYEYDYMSDLSISFDTPDLSTFTVSVICEIESDDEYGTYIDFTMRK